MFHKNLVLLIETVHKKQWKASFFFFFQDWIYHLYNAIKDKVTTVTEFKSLCFWGREPWALIIVELSPDIFLWNAPLARSVIPVWLRTLDQNWSTQNRMKHDFLCHTDTPKLQENVG